MHHHRMDRMARHGDGRADILFGDGANVRIGMVGKRPPFLLLHLVFFVVARVAGHRIASGVKGLVLLLTPVMLAGCSGQLSALDPAGPRAANLATLWWVMFAGSVVLFGLVMVLFALAWLRTG